MVYVPTLSTGAVTIVGSGEEVDLPDGRHRESLFPWS